MQKPHLSSFSKAVANPIKASSGLDHRLCRYDTIPTVLPIDRLHTLLSQLVYIPLPGLAYRGPLDPRKLWPRCANGRLFFRMYHPTHSNIEIPDRQLLASHHVTKLQPMGKRRPLGRQLTQALETKCPISLLVSLTLLRLWGQALRPTTFSGGLFLISH
jgi:hypothetical protein